MPREQKVGFTILIMIIGFAGAFCFRRQPEREVALPALQDESELNQLIAEYRLRPFLPGIDTDEAIESQEKLKQYLAMSIEAKKLASSQVKDVPQPIHSVIPGAIESRREQENSSQKKATTQTVSTNLRQNLPAGQSQTHVVQPGETLSGIAQKYLGSASRFLEIYEANRNVLSGPDQLKPNMKLSIPVKGAKTRPEVIKEARKSGKPKVSDNKTLQKANGKESGKTALAKSPSSKQHTKKKKFIPMKHSPFSRTASEKQEKRR